MSIHLDDHLVQVCGQYPDLKIQFTLQKWETDFLRFFRSEVNYNISRESSVLRVAVYKDKRNYSFRIVDPDPMKIEVGMNEVIGLIDHLPQDPDFVDLEDNLEIAPAREVPDNILMVPVDRKIGILETLRDATEKHGFKIFGTFITNRVRNLIVNSNGLRKESVNSPYMLEVKAVSDKNMVTVLESSGGEDFSKFHLDTFKESFERSVIAAKGELIDVEPGEYDVILAPRVIGELLGYLSYSISSRSLDQRSSFFEGKCGEKVFPEHITLTDDPENPDLIRFAYNGEGHIYRKTTLIENGVFRNFFVGNYYGRKLNLEKNGAMGACLVLKTGEKTLEEMIGGIRRGLYISSLHYTNFINPRETSVTGLTRDGTFLIEDGKITRVVNNLRYTQRVSEIVERIAEIESSAKSVPFSDNYGNFDINTLLMPHVRVNGFKISSSTKTV